MPTYNVLIPCTLSVCVTIEADDEAAAKDMALDVPFSVEVEPEGAAGIAASPEVVSFETHRKVAYGNVYEGVQNEIEVTEA